MAAPGILKVVYRHSLLTGSQRKQKPETFVLPKEDLSTDVVNAIHDNHLLAAGGYHGITDSGDVLQIDSLDIWHESGHTRITLYNLGVMLFVSDDEIYQAFNRVVCAIRQQGIRRVSRHNAGNPSPLTEGSVHQIKVTLTGTSPPVWRRFLIPSNVTLHRLHLVIQKVMGWQSIHLYRFQIRRREYAIPEPDDAGYDSNFLSAKSAKLGRLLPNKGETFVYEYHFGNRWNHQMIVEDIFQADPQQQYPICLTGSRACPPEECGSTRGYDEFIEALKSPRTKRQKDMLKRIGRGFDPEFFDLELVNDFLRGMQRPRSKRTRIADQPSFETTDPDRPLES